MNHTVKATLFSTVVMLGCILGAGAGYCAENSMPLSLADCFKRALSDNLNLQSASLGIRYDALAITSAESNFDPTLSLNVDRSQSGSPNYTSYIPVDKISEKSTYASLSLGKTVSTGAKLGFGTYNALSESNVERVKNYSGYVGFNVTQPLLRGWGKRNVYSNVYIARLAGDASIHTVENNAISLLADVEKAYWNLVYARETLAVRELALAQADSLLTYNQKGMELGVLIESDVLEAKSAFFSRQQEILEQQIQIQDAEDALKLLLNITGKGDGTQHLEPTEKPAIPDIDLNEETALQTALQFRPDYLQDLNDIEQQKLRLAATRNAMLPELDLNAAYRLNGSGTTYGKNWRNLGNGDSYGWEVGLNLAYPLKNRSARTDYQRMEITLKRAQLNLESLKSSIITNIRSTMGKVQTNRKKIDVAKMTVEMNELKLRKEEERFRNHLSTSYLVLQYQTDLANARNLYNKALMDYTLSILDLRQSRGTLLKDLDINIIPKK